MSCVPNNCGGHIVVVYPPCPTTCPPVGTPNVTNINFTGVGVYDSTSNGTLLFRGVEGDNQYITSTLDAANNAIKLSLTFSGGGFTATFANTAARNANIPTAIGQIGFQVDNTNIYYATGTSAGNWNLIPIGDGTNVTINNGITFTLNSGATSKFRFFDSGGLAVDFVDGEVDFYHDLQIQGTGRIVMNGGSVFDYVTGSVLKIDSVSIPANSVLTTSGTAGFISSALINTFLSAANTSNGYSFSNDTPLKTFDVSTIGIAYDQTVLQNIANLLVTLARDLMNLKVPKA